MSCDFSEGCPRQGCRGGGPDTLPETVPVTPRDHLNQLPGLILLNRLPTPALALGLEGEVVFANPAFAAMFGYTDSSALNDVSLSSLMVGQADTPAKTCLTALRAAAGTVADWRHADGYHLHAVVSKPLLTRATDPVLLIILTDVTDVLWDATA